MERHPEDRRRGRRRPSARGLWRGSLLVLAVLAICVLAFGSFKHFRLETIIIAAVFAFAGISIFLYIGELVVIGWVVDVLSQIGVPKIKARPLPLVWEQVGDIVVVTLRDNIATAEQCLTVQRQLKCLIDEHHCNFVLDFSDAGNISRRFRWVMIHVTKAARTRRPGSANPIDPWRSLTGRSSKSLTTGSVPLRRCPSTTDMDGSSLCSVPVGIRAVYGWDRWSGF